MLQHVTNGLINRQLFAPHFPVQAVLLTAVVAVLPRSVREVHLNCNCKGLFLRQLRRFPNLQQLVLGGNVAFAHWEDAAPVLRTLHGGLHLDCRSQGQYDADVPRKQQTTRRATWMLAVVSLPLGVTCCNLPLNWGDTPTSHPLRCLVRPAAAHSASSADVLKGGGRQWLAVSGGAGERRCSCGQRQEPRSHFAAAG